MVKYPRSDETDVTSFTSLREGRGICSLEYIYEDEEGCDRDIFRKPEWGRERTSREMSDPLHIPNQTKGNPNLLSPESPGHNYQLPSPILTRRTRTVSTNERALENPVERGKVKYFSRSKGHGFITPIKGEEDIFLHISDIEGEYVPREGDEVTYRLCIIPPKCEKYQAVHVKIVNFTPEVHNRWESPVSEEESNK